MSLDVLKQNLGLGYRGNKFVASFAPKGASLDGNVISALCKVASLPSKTIGSVEVHSQGHKMTLAGEAQFEGTYSMTFWNTPNLNIRSVIIDWMDIIDSVQTGERSVTQNDDYMSFLEIKPLDTSSNEVIEVYTFKNAFPTELAEVALDTSSVDEITEQEVTFAYSHWVKS